MGEFHNHLPSLNPSAHPRLRKVSFTKDQKDWVTNAFRQQGNGSAATASGGRLIQRLKSEMELRQQDGDDDEEGNMQTQNVLVTDQDLRNFRRKQELLVLDGKSEIEV